MKKFFLHEFFPGNIQSRYLFDHLIGTIKLWIIIKLRSMSSQSGLEVVHLWKLEDSNLFLPSITGVLRECSKQKTVPSVPEFPVVLITIRKNNSSSVVEVRNLCSG